MSHYLIRIGEGSKYIEEAKKHNFIAIGWNEVPNLANYKTLEKLKVELMDQYSYSPAQLGAQAGQVFRFYNELKIGDIVLSPLGQGKYAVGEVGEYFYEINPTDNCPYIHRRHVQWLDKILDKADMSSNLTYSLGGILTIFSIEKYASELQNLISGKAISPAEKPERIKDIIINGLLELNGKEFEEFISHLLTIIGFEAQTTQYVGDKGVDVNGILNAEGVAQIILRVQVKRLRSSIGNKDILAMRGTLAQGEHGCFITLSNFSKQAQEEAESPNKIPIKLIDKEDLASLVLKNYDDLDDKYKQLFSLRKRKDFNIEDLFEIEQELVPITEKIIVGKSTIAPFDTLVCAAKEDGFKEAFIDKKAWWAVRINESNIPAIKYLAMYQVAPISAITHYGEVQKIEKYQDTDKYILYLKDVHELKTPIDIGKNKYLKPQAPRYSLISKILKGKVLEDIF